MKINKTFYVLMFLLIGIGLILSILQRWGIIFDGQNAMITTSFIVFFILLSWNTWTNWKRL